MITIEREFWVIMSSVLTALLLIAILACSVAASAQRKKDQSKPVKKSHVRVVDKPHPSGAMLIASLVVFELDNGERIRLLVNGKEYTTILIGDTGELTWQGTQYISFKRG